MLLGSAYHDKRQVTSHCRSHRIIQGSLIVTLPPSARSMGQRHGGMLAAHQKEDHHLWLSCWTCLWSGTRGQEQTDHPLTSLTHTSLPCQWPPWPSKFKSEFVYNCRHHMSAHQGIIIAAIPGVMSWSWHCTIIFLLSFPFHLVPDHSTSAKYQKNLGALSRLSRLISHLSTISLLSCLQWAYENFYKLI